MWAIWETRAAGDGDERGHPHHDEGEGPGLDKGEDVAAREWEVELAKQREDIFRCARSQLWQTWHEYLSLCIRVWVGGCVG